VNASGLIESVASGVLRLDYPIGGGCPAALIEPSAQNLVLQSRDLSVSGNWTASGITAVKNAVGADGTASGATTLTATAASGTITQALSHASQSRIFSAVIRRVSGSGAVELTTNGGTNWDAVTLTTDYSQLACTARTVASGTVGIRMIASGDVIEVDYTQGEVGPVATSPIPTTTGSATRNADVCSVSGVSGYIGQTQGTLYAEVDIRAISVEGYIIRIGLASFNDTIFLTRSSANNLSAIIRQGGSNIFSGATSGLGAGRFKIALAYSNNSHALYVNGNAIASGTTALSYSVTLSDIRLGGFSDTAALFNDRIRAAAIYTTRLSNEQLESITRLT